MLKHLNISVRLLTNKNYRLGTSYLQDFFAILVSQELGCLLTSRT